MSSNFETKIITDKGSKVRKHKHQHYRTSINDMAKSGETGTLLGVLSYGAGNETIGFNSRNKIFDSGNVKTTPNNLET